MKTRKSKTLYIAVLIGLMSIAIIDHMQPNDKTDKIAVGTHEDQWKDNFEYALLTK
ncbi:hypothetical protein [Ekhidna sp.]